MVTFVDVVQQLIFIRLYRVIAVVISVVIGGYLLEMNIMGNRDMHLRLNII